MSQGNFIDDLAKCLSEMMPTSVREVQKDIGKNIYAALQAAFSKLNLVSREEHKAQTNVLAKTRQKLEKLEKQVSELEMKKSPKNHESIKK